MFGAAFMVAFVGVFAWGCLTIIARHYGLLLPLFHPAIAIAVNFGGPVLLILGAGFSWLRARTWRKMSVLRVTPPGGAGTKLARGEYSFELVDSGPSRLERLTAALLTLGFLTIPYWLGVPSPEIWILGGSTFWVFRRALF